MGAGRPSPQAGDGAASSSWWMARWWLALLLVLVAGPLTATGEPPPPTSLDEALEALSAGRLDEAAVGFATLRVERPEDPRPVLGEAAVAEARGELLQALDLSRRAMSLAPDDAESGFTTGRLLVRLGAPAEALAVLEQVREIEPRASRGYLLAALVLRDVQRHDAAIALLDEAAGRGVDDPDLDQQRALLRLGANRVTEAREIAVAAVGRHPEHAGLRLAAGLALAQGQGAEPESARRHLERALELGIESPGRVRLELGTLLVESGESGAALPHLEAAVVDPGTPEAWYQLGLARRAEGDAEGARSALERFRELAQRRDAADHAGKTLGTRLNEIQQLAAANRLDEALSHIDTLLEQYPDEGRGHALRAKMLFSVGQIEGAVEAIGRARALLPAYAEHHYLEGYFLLHQGRLEPAAEALGRALAIDPTLGRAHALLAGIAAEGGRLDEAATGFERAFSLGLEDPAFEAIYRQVLERLGRSPG